MFTTHPQDQFIHNNEDAVFECAANGSESLNISWIRNNELISNSKSNKIQHDGNTSILKIKETTIDNSGIYQCIATNADNEEVFSKLAELLSKIHYIMKELLASTCDCNSLSHSSTINEHTS